MADLSWDLMYDTVTVPEGLHLDFQRSLGLLTFCPLLALVTQKYSISRLQFCISGRREETYEPWVFLMLCLLLFIQQSPHQGR
jgi:hypothetical protein